MSETTRAGEGVARAIARIEESRRSHSEWAEHIPNCAHCVEHGPPPYIQTQAEHEQIVAEYDEVLATLRGIPARESEVWDECVRAVAGVDPNAIHNPYREYPPASTDPEARLACCGHTAYDHSAANVNGCYRCECEVDR